MSNSETKIEIKHLYKIFGDDPETMLRKVRDGVTKDELNDQYNHVLGLSDINLKMLAKGIQVVMGLSGSGKSTLIRHINRLIEPTTGEVWIDGENVLEMNEKTLREFRRNRASMVFQKFALLPHRTVMENTIYGLEIQGMGEKRLRNRRLTGLIALVLPATKKIIPANYRAVCNNEWVLPERSPRMPIFC